MRGRKKQRKKRGRPKRYFETVFFCERCGRLTNYVFGWSEEDPERLKARVCRICWEEMKQ